MKLFSAQVILDILCFLFFVGCHSSKHIEDQKNSVIASQSCTYKSFDEERYAVGDIILAPHILFSLSANNSSELDSLKIVADFLIRNPNLVIELILHTDFRGTEYYNITLSRQRSSECRDYICEIGGIEPCRIIPVGNGDLCPRVIDYCPVIFDPWFTAHYGQIPMDLFSIGDTLNEEFIKALPQVRYREAAHYLNRRMEIKVISVDYPVKKK